MKQYDPFEGVPDVIKDLFKRPPLKGMVDEACEMFLSAEVCDALDAAFENDDPNIEVELPYLGGVKVKAKDAKQLYKHYRNHVSGLLLASLKMMIMSVETSTLINTAMVLKEAGVDLPPHIQNMLSQIPDSVKQQMTDMQHAAPPPEKETWDKSSRMKKRASDN